MISLSESQVQKYGQSTYIGLSIYLDFGLSIYLDFGLSTYLDRSLVELWSEWVLRPNFEIGLT